MGTSAALGAGMAVDGAGGMKIGTESLAEGLWLVALSD